MATEVSTLFRRRPNSHPGGRSRKPTREPGEVLRNLEPAEWSAKVGSARVREVCEMIGVSPDVFRHICNGRRKFSPDMATRFVLATNGELSFEGLCRYRITPEGLPILRDEFLGESEELDAA